MAPEESSLVAQGGSPEGDGYETIAPDGAVVIRAS